VELNYVADVSERHAALHYNEDGSSMMPRSVGNYRPGYIWRHIPENINIRREGRIRERGIAGGVGGRDKCRKMRENRI
jgi:hypothetical protein